MEQFEESLWDASRVNFWKGVTDASELIVSRIWTFRTAISSAETILRNLRKEWPDGESAYQEMEITIGNMHDREKVAREWFEVLETYDNSDKPMEVFVP